MPGVSVWFLLRVGWRLVLLLGLTSSISPQQGWLSRDKSHRHLNAVALSGSKSIQPQLVNAIGKRHARTRQTEDPPPPRRKIYFNSLQTCILRPVQALVFAFAKD